MMVWNRNGMARGYVLDGGMARRGGMVWGADILLDATFPFVILQVA
jgi:hypothetical protein